MVTWEIFHWNKLLLVQRQILDFPCRLFMLYIFLPLFVLNTILSIDRFLNASSVHRFLAKCTMLYWVCTVVYCMKKCLQTSKWECLYMQIIAHCLSCFFLSFCRQPVVVLREWCPNKIHESLPKVASFLPEFCLLCYPFLFLQASTLFGPLPCSQNLSAVFSQIISLVKGKEASNCNRL
jgi:hypothetical protein